VKINHGFNKAHAACYATIAYRTAYLKANFPVEFMTALLTAESRGSSGPVKNEKIAQAISECKRLGLTVLQPDINKSHSDFIIEDRVKIRFGLSAIKNVGEAAINNMRILLNAHKIIINPKCIKLIKHMEEGTWKRDLSSSSSGSFSGRRP